MSDREEAWDKFFESGFYLKGWNFRIDPERTREEIEGVLALLKPKPGTHILDWCGGYGRHSIELAKRGFQVTLLDKAPNHVELARAKAKEAGVDIDLVCADFRETPPEVQADLAVNLFTAGLSYLRRKDDVLALKSLHAALRPRAGLLIDTMSLFWLARNYQPMGWHRDETDTMRLLEERQFDFLTNRNLAATTIWEKGKGEQTMEFDQRIYTPAELATVLRQAGFRPERLYGGFDGSDFGFDSQRIVIIARRV